ncbi:hypothetical protein AVEN_87677-1 [Araneus ventricosus]|uniref:Uncharacterized protein n=1 Tax=Araneus ventricosus TaxID=182803 RepID=A0A4Y2CYT8_ARAVE|nr:hypothetical protein AVEN_87677-1 [Araneus ventricosus]
MCRTQRHGCEHMRRRVHRLLPQWRKGEPEQFNGTLCNPRTQMPNPCDRVELNGCTRGREPVRSGARGITRVTEEVEQELQNVEDKV